ncbi:hypothetical protein FCOIX_12026 [Fusarium coicis]|nr:hypothetical protein FCOIX_12026 [Fusarium coicis]
MPSKMLSELRKFLTSFVEKVPEYESQARFGHIQMPPYRLGEGDCPDMTFLVVPDSEKVLGTGVNEHDTIKATILSFSDLLYALRATKELAPQGEEWGYRTDDAAVPAWQEHKLLPISIVMVIYLDPLMPSACALSLIGIVKWAIQMSFELESDIRLLAMLAEEDFKGRIFHSSWRQRRKCPNSSDVNVWAEGVLECMRDKPEWRRLVSFNAGFPMALETKMTREDRKLVKTLHMDAATTVQPLAEVRAGGFKTYFLTIRGELSTLPPILDGYDEIHVIPGSSNAFRTDWDEFRCQMVVSSYPASREDRQLQMWWIRQDSTPSRFIYPGQAPQALINAGGSRLRLVESAELGVLPAFGFDHSLALLAALDSGPLVRRVKVQLACMLKLGSVNRISVHGDQFNKPESRKQILDGCHGAGRSLANRGAMWLGLGLIKNHLRNAELKGGYDKSADDLKKFVTIKQQDALKFNTEVRKVLLLLPQNGISVDDSEPVAELSRR